MPSCLPGYPQVAKWRIGWLVSRSGGLMMTPSDSEPKQSPDPVPSAELVSISLNECGSLLCS